MPGYALIRQLEAVGFRAWPATSVHFDGTWAIRLTAAHPSKRLNCVNPLDPADTGDLEERVERAIQRFRTFGRRPTFRQTPLSPETLDAYLVKKGWDPFDETIVMTLDISTVDLKDAIDQIPLKDIGRFVEANLQVRERDAALKPGLSEVIGAISPVTGLFVVEDDGVPVSTAMCVHEGTLAGLFEVGTYPPIRRQGQARKIVASALKWARKQGATTAWLQVEKENEAALALYEGFGFQEAYRYFYRQGEPE
jgi:ribosomal protein S18 acetylase RimI-like enzyme